VTKYQEIVKATGIELQRRHGARVTWSQCCFGRLALYAAAFRAKSSGFLAHLHPNLCMLIDGTYRPISRPAPGPNGEDVQRLFYNGWLHGCKITFTSIVSPDGMIASLTGPFTGIVNDMTKVR
jgi:hypothetical protein